MKNFYLKHKNKISIILDILLILMGIYSKNIIFVIVGIALFALTLYVSKLEKEEEKRKAEIAAEKKALKAEQKRLNKCKKKKKKKKR